jgi:CheY-like chemotaxis protein
MLSHKIHRAMRSPKIYVEFYVEKFFPVCYRILMPGKLSNPVSILIADDDAQDAMLVQMAVRRASLGLRLDTVSDGEEAINYLLGRYSYADRSTHPFPNLMLLDLKMPRLNGFDVLDFVRRQPGLRQLPVVIFSSSDDPGDIRRAYDAGANSYLCKPHSNDDLSALLRALEEYWCKFNHFPPCH